ncbi:MAG: pyridoxal phosphate-dependent aminotransferase [Eubacteriales bacterium]|jgi:aminotransferase|nr:pyridoxal phosphate-dependent aminotransferase [Eubacteriales bacterium]
MSFLSEKSKGTPSSVIREFVGLSYKYDQVLSFGFGQPDFVTPRHILDAASASIQRGETFYAPNTGILPLREAISNSYAKRGLSYSPDEILVGSGAISVLLLAATAVLDIGDEMIISDPCYASYDSLAIQLGAVPVRVRVTEENGFMFDPEDVRAAITDKTKVLLLNSPSNPTGGVATRENLEALAKLCIEKDIYVITDEIYRELLWTDEPYVSITEFPGMRERTMIIDGFSKTYAMTGLRLGYAVGPREVIVKMTQLLENVLSSVFTAVQWAGVAALTESQDCVKEMMDLYRHRRKLLLEGINDIDGISCKDPKGAFYLFANIQSTGLDSRTFATKLLEQEKMLVIPGVGFGPGGEGFVRFCYATNDENINEGIQRLRRFMKTL